MTALETVKQYYNCFNNKDYQGMLSLLDDGIRHEPNQGEPRIGKGLFTEFLKHMEDCYDEQLADMQFFIGENGIGIAVEFVVNGRYLQGEEGLPAAHGQHYVLPAASFLEVKSDRITRVATFYNLPLWIKLVS
ncbi:MAG: nuclear transport factor 2 family protein [Saprospiraceae bacterium]|nr:nuclear transport factor 2 family protein [Saprospiraceae bacterium]